MIWTLITIAAALVLTALFFVADYNNWDVLMVIGAIGAVFSGTALLFMIVVIISVHATADIDIAKNKLQYQKIIKEIEAVDNEWEDISAIKVIEDVNEWNEDLTSVKHWGKSPWTNWYYSQKFVDAFDYIVIDEGK